MPDGNGTWGAIIEQVDPMVVLETVLDRAVLAAYAAIDPEGHWSEDWATLYTETGAGQPLPKDHPQSAQRAEVDQKILTNLLRLNQERTART